MIRLTSGQGTDACSPSRQQTGDGSEIRGLHDPTEHGQIDRDAHGFVAYIKCRKEDRNWLLSAIASWDWRLPSTRVTAPPSIWKRQAGCRTRSGAVAQLAGVTVKKW